MLPVDATRMFWCSKMNMRHVNDNGNDCVANVRWKLSDNEQKDNTDELNFVDKNRP